ncbi:hypothetical protein L1049_007296 [Liquidambar formosana]|uniref:SH3 domain-containing protein n=1 Tax=Liquidambar formosana TaxID=63359 RepID=A0AAP0WSA5_LIQFO
MESIRKQASKFREQVAKQQQAILKQLGHFCDEAVMVDEAQLQCLQQLKNIYVSTRAAKHFQKDIVRGVEGIIRTSSEEMEIGRKLAEDCSRYGNENEGTGSHLARAALHFGTSWSSIEKERETLLGVLSDQVSNPLRVLIKGAPLEDAHLLTHRYDRLHQEMEAQAAEVLRRQSKSKDPASSAESSIKLQGAEAKLAELKSTMMALGREATTAMSSVEAQQQRKTFQQLLTMVDAEKSYHQSVLSVLQKLHAKMILDDDGATNGSDGNGPVNQITYFIARVIHPFDAQADGELSLSVDDYIVVRQVGPNGWSEGECKGKAGWFPSAYIERQDKAPVSKITEETASP